MDTIGRSPEIPATSAGLTAIGQTLVLWQDRARQRAHLASLDDRILRDIGIGRVEVAREASKPFWRA